MFADEFLPVYDVSDEVATVVAAEPHAVWQGLLDADLIEAGKRTPLAGLAAPMSEIKPRDGAGAGDDLARRPAATAEFAS